MQKSKWHFMEIGELCRELGINPGSGLTKDEAAGRLKEYGPNVLQENLPAACCQFLSPR